MHLTNIKIFLQKSIACILFIVIISGCAANGLIRNTAIDATDQDNSYSIKAFRQSLSSPNNSVILAFSGGGTRAAALSYGVLQELRDTIVTSTSNDSNCLSNKKYPLLDDVGLISSVSGGSFTAAYYGLNGDKIFTDFEDVFLKKKCGKSPS
jgi:NTE family protein